MDVKNTRKVDKKIHYPSLMCSGVADTGAVCGVDSYDPSNGSHRNTRDIEDVSCKRCLRSMNNG